MRIKKKKEKKETKEKQILKKENKKRVSVQKHVRLFKETFFSPKKEKNSNRQRHVLF